MEKFEYKSDAQLEAMNTAERDTYAKEKREHEANLIKTERDAAIKLAVEAVTKTFEEKATKQTEELTSLKGIVTLQEATIKTQGEEIAKKPVMGQAFSSVKAEELRTELKAIQEASAKGDQTQKIEIKAFTGDDAMGVENFPNAAGNGTITGAVASITQYFAQLIPGIFKKPVPTSNILDYCNVIPLAGEQLVSISETRTINMAITAEGVEKPVSKATWSALSVTAKPVVSLFKTTSQMRKFFAVFVTSFYNTLVAFVNKLIPAKVITEINAAATAFTPVSAQIIYTAPNDFDAIVQMIASLVNLGYIPNVAKVSNFTYSAMKTLKSEEDGHYMLANNGSINILDSTISFGDIKVKLDTDVEFGNDDVLVGDLTVVNVGLDSKIEYYEAYEGNDFKTNKKSHLLEKYVAVNVPTAVRTGITKDTLTNVKTLITVAP